MYPEYLKGFQIKVLVTSAFHAWKDTQQLSPSTGPLATVCAYYYMAKCAAFALHAMLEAVAAAFSIQFAAAPIPSMCLRLSRAYFQTEALRQLPFVCTHGRFGIHFVRSRHSLMILHMWTTSLLL
jgi:hypothetical protein